MVKVLSDKRKNVLLYITVLLLTAAVLFVYVLFDPEKSELFPKCIFHTVTGMKCPGCGSQRAVHQLLNGNFIDALRYNALAVISIPYILLGIYLSISDRNQTNKSLHRLLYEGKAVYVILAAVIIFWILRNMI